MVEALTDKNLEIGERCGELEVTVADLESSVELSEELEMQQAEEIRELQVCRMVSLYMRVIVPAHIELRWTRAWSTCWVKGR